MGRGWGRGIRFVGWGRVLGGEKREGETRIRLEQLLLAGG